MAHGMSAATKTCSCNVTCSTIFVTFILLSMVALGNGTRIQEENFQSSNHAWPDLKFNWRVVVGTIIAFVGGSLGCVGGIGGGGIFVPMLVLVIGFDQKSSTALSKCMIMGAAAASVLFNFRLSSPIIDYNLALIFQPLLMLGISIGVVFNVIFPNWVVTFLLIIIFTGTATKSFLKGISLWKKESIERTRDSKAKSVHQQAVEAGIENGSYVALEPVQLHELQPTNLKTNWKSIGLLLYVWISFLILQILKNYSSTCSTLYWTWSLLQVPVAASAFLRKAVTLYTRNHKVGNQERFIYAARIDWTIPRLCVCALAGLIAGIVGGLLGLGGGFILGPLFLEFGVTPQVAGATATFVMLFSSSMSVIEYYLLHRFPVPFAIYLFTVNAAAGFWAQYVLRKIVDKFGRASMIVFLLSLVILVSAICLGGYGIEDSIVKLENKEYMGFLNLCSS